MEKLIKQAKDIAIAKYKARQHFLEQREGQLVKDELIKDQTAPLIAPIVEAIEKNAIKKTKEVALVSEEDIYKFMKEMDKIAFDKKNFKTFVAKLYKDENLFNLFLVLIKMRVYDVPIDKAVQKGVLESLIFYGQGGTNLDLLPVAMQTEEFKTQLSNYNEFYKNNHKIIEQVVGDREKEEIPESESEPEEEEKMPDLKEPELEDGDGEDDKNIAFGDLYNQWMATEGSGLGGNSVTKDSLTERLSILHASKNAGNTSLDIINEAQDIIKILLKIGGITKQQYLELVKLF